MHCQPMRTRTSRPAISRSRLYEPHTGVCYAGCSQPLFEKQLTVAYIVAPSAPDYGATLVDRMSGKQYQVKNIIHLQNGEYLSMYEIVLGHK